MSLFKSIEDMWAYLDWRQREDYQKFEQAKAKIEHLQRLYSDLRCTTGQDFGYDREQWQAWFDAHPEHPRALWNRLCEQYATQTDKQSR